MSSQVEQEFHFFEAVIAEGERRYTTEKPLNMGGSITKWNVDSSFFTSTDGFGFEFIGKDQEDRRGLEAAPLELLIDGNSMLHGRIDVTRRGDRGPSIVTVSGRDYIADLVEGNVDPTVSIAAGTILDDAILTACAPYGIIEVEGPEARQFARTKKQQKPAKRRSKKQITDAKPEPGQGVYDWCNRILARHHLTLQPGSDPTKVVLQAPNYDQDPIGRIIRKNIDDRIVGNVIEGTATRDYSRVPTYGMFAGRQGKATEKTSRTFTNFDLRTITGNTAPELAAAQKYMVEGRLLPKKRQFSIPRQLYRLLYWRDELAKTQEQIDASLKRAVADRTKETLVYEVTVHGLCDPQTGKYWAVDTIVDVDDDVADVHEKLWVETRNASFDGREYRALMRCYRPGSFVIGDENG